MMNGEHAFATTGGTAWRRRQRRLRAFRRFVLWHSKMEVAAALHHSSGLRTSTTAQFSSTAVEPIAPRVVGSLLPAEEATGPVYDHVHQEQFAAGEMSENMVEFHVVQEQVIVQAIPVVDDSLPLVEEFTGPGFYQVHHEHIAAVPAVTEFFPMSDDEGGELSAGLRPAPLWEPLPEERIQRHTSEQMIESFVPVPMLDLDAPVPQTVDSVGEVLKILDKLVPDVEQVIDMPMIYPEDFRVRTFRSSLLEPQTAEQLVEVLGFDFVFVRHIEGASSIAVCRAAGHTWGFNVHDTGWSDTAGPGRYTNIGHR